MNYESSAKQILNVLGKDNIQSATHCMTRLRFVLKDEAGIDDERVKKIPGIRFDLDAIRQAGYDVTTPVIVTNSNDYIDVIGKEGAHADAMQPLLYVM